MPKVPKWKRKRSKGTPKPKHCEAVVAEFSTFVQECGLPAVAVIYDSNREERAVCNLHRRSSKKD